MANIKKRKNGIETSQRILEIAAERFARKGYDNVSLREIADAAGIKESSLYNHFKGKAAIKESLFTLFAQLTFQSRPSEAELDKMLLIMQPEEIFKNILFTVGMNISAILRNIIIMIHNEKFINTQAAAAYHQHLIVEPVEYYTRLIEKMIHRKMIRAVDARLFAEQYNYVSAALTEEYFMAQNGMADPDTVVRSMLRTLHFFVELIKE